MKKGLFYEADLIEFNESHMLLEFSFHGRLPNKMVRHIIKKE